MTYLTTVTSTMSKNVGWTMLGLLWVLLVPRYGKMKIISFEAVKNAPGLLKNVITPLPTYPGDYLTVQGGESNRILH